MGTSTLPSSIVTTTIVWLSLVMSTTKTVCGQNAQPEAAGTREVVGNPGSNSDGNPRMNALQRPTTAGGRMPRRTIKPSGSDTAIVERARRDSSSDGHTDGEPDEGKEAKGNEAGGTKTPARDEVPSVGNNDNDYNADEADEARNGKDGARESADSVNEIDQVLYGALKKAKFNKKIKEIEARVRDFVLGAPEVSELTFEEGTTETTFERLLVHRVAQHWGLTTLVLADRCTIVGRWPDGRERKEPPTVLGSLAVELEDEQESRESAGSTRSTRSIRSIRSSGSTGSAGAAGPSSTKKGSRRERPPSPGGSGSPYSSMYYDQQIQYFYEQMMYHQHHQQHLAMMSMQQQGVGVNNGYARTARNASPMEGSPVRQAPGSPADPMNMMNVSAEFERALTMGESPMYQQQMHGGYGGPPPPMMGGGMPVMHGPYGMHMPVVPIMLPDGRIVYQQQPIHPIAVPPPPPPPRPRRQRGGDVEMQRSGSDGSHH